MKKIKLLKAIAMAFGCLIVLTTSCKKDLQAVNTSPNSVTTPTLSLVLPDIELLLLDQAYYCNLTVVGQIMNQVSSYGTNFQTITIGGNPEYHFNYQYGGPIKNLISLVYQTQGKPQLINYNCIARILKVYAFQSVTDVYGDVPYFNAGDGYITGNVQPTYDPQSKIYADMFSELSDAASKFDATQPLVQNDIVYKGNIASWQKFAYSLMLRLALRIQKVDPANSSKWANLAYKSGLMQSNNDNFVVNYKPNTYYATISNGQSTPFVYYTTWKLAAPFVDYLKSNNDPRIYIYSALPNGDTVAAHQFGLPPNTPSNQVPLPLTSYSVSPATTFGQYSAPFIHLSYSQVQFMLAELSLKGIITGLGANDAVTFYNNGVNAAMNELSIYGGKYTLTQGAINTYLQNHQLNTAIPDTALSQINTQYWVETHYNFYEQFSNWRRSGYPILNQSNYVIPRRLMYPVAENNINAAGVAAAIKDQGPDLPTTKVWWDK